MNAQLLREGRSLHLVDVENLLGGTTFGEADVAATATAYKSVAAVGGRDQVIVSSSHYTARAVWYGWGDARRVVRSGPNGADLRLIDIIETERLAARFTRVVIGSGDWIFAEPAARLQSLGVQLAVVARPDSLSRQLRLAVRDVRYLEVLPHLAPAVAQRAA